MADGSFRAWEVIAIAPPIEQAARDPLVDRAFLTSVAYRDDTHLSARQQLYHFADPPTDFYGWALALVDWSHAKRVVDVGCGNGMYLSRLSAMTPAATLVGADLSAGMLHSVSSGWDGRLAAPALMVADAEAIAVPDRSFDVALAMHVLHHVPRIEAAVMELRRVLGDDGVLLASTKGEGHLESLRLLVADALGALGGTDGFGGWSARFTLASGCGALTTAFGRVTLHHLPGRLAVPSPQPVMSYVDASRGLIEPLLPDGCRWSDLLREVRARVSDAIADAGCFRDRTMVGAFVCQR